MRAWDWTAIGAWAGAGAMVAWAIVSFAAHPDAAGAPGGSARLVVGAAAARVEGTF